MTNTREQLLIKLLNEQAKEIDRLITVVNKYKRLLDNEIKITSIYNVADTLNRFETSILTEEEMDKIKKLKGKI